jgi:hypothetical protein
MVRVASLAPWWFTCLTNAAHAQPTAPPAAAEPTGTVAAGVG